MNLRRFHGTVSLDPARVLRHASRIADEVITRLSKLSVWWLRLGIRIERIKPAGLSKTAATNVCT